MSTEEEGKSRGIYSGGGGSGDQQSPPQYGTFQGLPPSYPQQPSIGYPQTVSPPGLTGASPYYPHGYQGYIVEGTPVDEHRHRRLPICGCGVGWFLFIIGFFTAAIPWYVGAFILLCVRINHREKPGMIACTIAAVLSAVAIVIGASSH